MENISRYIKHYLLEIRKDCPSFDESENVCNREGGCVCLKTSEILANIRSLIPEEYRNTNLFTFNGKVGNKRVLPGNKAAEVRGNLWDYMYKGEIDPSIDNLSRNQMNALSVLDQRFKKGSNLVIHGDQKSLQGNSSSPSFIMKQEPKGKTLLASAVMIDAIWRRSSPNSIARTYDWISFLRLRQGLKKNAEYVHEAQDADWLVIDDICKIEKSNSAGWTKETLDDFIISRSDEGKPTILVFDFDVEKVSLADVMGSGIAKIVESGNTYRVKV